jgi:hypothetical protein
MPGDRTTMPRNPHLPSLRRHKPSKQGVVTLNGHDHYLGRWADDLVDPPAHVEAVLPLVLPPVAAMIRLQRTIPCAGDAPP